MLFKKNILRNSASQVGVLCGAAGLVKIAFMPGAFTAAVMLTAAGVLLVLAASYIPQPKPRTE